MDPQGQDSWCIPIPAKEYSSQPAIKLGAWGKLYSQWIHSYEKDLGESISISIIVVDHNSSH